MNQKIKEFFAVWALLLAAIASICGFVVLLILSLAHMPLLAVLLMALVFTGWVAWGIVE